jgi:hypothetical protein
MRIVPVNFNSEHKGMLGHCKMILESEDGRIAINPDKFDKLITALRTAIDNDGTLDKEVTSYNDIFDACIICAPTTVLILGTIIAIVTITPARPTTKAILALEKFSSDDESNKCVGDRENYHCR